MRGPRANRDEPDRGIIVPRRLKWVKARQWVLKKQIAAWLLDAAFPLILAFSLGEKEGVLRPAWNSKAALTHPAARFFCQAGNVSPSPRGPG
jgi:hypothetical protein